ncbi:MAG: hypothetical protein KDK50_04020 [Chlamydiia bacterium]|nr:hypothetical protein [Chlamydiia bacterium]
MSSDFNSISTWRNIDLQQACLRLSSGEENEALCNPGALRVVCDLFKRLDEDGQKRAQFCLNCEKLGLRGWKLFHAYRYSCHENYDYFVQCVLGSDEAMIKDLKDAEKQL